MAKIEPYFHKVLTYLFSFNFKNRIEYIWNIYLGFY